MDGQYFITLCNTGHSLISKFYSATYQLIFLTILIKNLTKDGHSLISLAHNNPIAEANIIDYITNRVNSFNDEISLASEMRLTF